MGVKFLGKKHYVILEWPLGMGRGWWRQGSCGNGEGARIRKVCGDEEAVERETDRCGKGRGTMKEEEIVKAVDVIRE